MATAPTTPAKFDKAKADALFAKGKEFLKHPEKREGYTILVIGSDTDANTRQTMINNGYTETSTTQGQKISIVYVNDNDPEVKKILQKSIEYPLPQHPFMVLTQNGQMLRALYSGVVPAGKLNYEGLGELQQQAEAKQRQEIVKAPFTKAEKDRLVALRKGEIFSEGDDVLLEKLAIKLAEKGLQALDPKHMPKDAVLMTGDTKCSHCQRTLLMNSTLDKDGNPVINPTAGGQLYFLDFISDPRGAKRLGELPGVKSILDTGLYIAEKDATNPKFQQPLKDLKAQLQIVRDEKKPDAEREAAGKKAEAIISDELPTLNHSWPAFSLISNGRVTSYLLTNEQHDWKKLNREVVKTKAELAKPMTKVEATHPGTSEQATTGTKTQTAQLNSSVYL